MVGYEVDESGPLGDDHVSVGEEGRGHLDCRVEETPGIVPHVEHDGLDTLVEQRSNLLQEELVGVVRECVEPDIARVSDHLADYGLDDERGAGDGHVEDFSIPSDGQHDIRARRAPHRCGDFVHSPTGDVGAIHAQDQIVRLETGRVGGGAIDGRDDVDDAGVRDDVAILPAGRVLGSDEGTDPLDLARLLLLE